MSLVHNSNILFSGYHRPLYLDELYIRGHWILDNISVSGYDSKNFWDLQVSGNPVQCPGYIRTSGMVFDGIDDALLVDVSTTIGTSTIPIVGPETGSGLWPLEPHLYIPRSDWVANSSQGSAFGMLMRLKMDEFPPTDAPIGGASAPEVQTYHWVLASAWEGSGSSFTNYTRQFHISIVNPSSIKVQYHRRSSTALYQASIYTTYPYNLPSGEWFTLGCHFVNNESLLNCSNIFIVSGQTNINLKITTASQGNLEVRPSGAAAASPAPSKLVFGCLGAGRYPSGFFKGCIEEIIWFNGGSPNIPQTYAFHSGNIQQTRPTFGNLTYPYLTANWRMEKFFSGVAIPGAYGWIAENKTGLTWVEDSGPYKMHLIVSGTLTNDPGSGRILGPIQSVVDGAHNLYNIHKSGIGQSSAVTTRFLYRPTDYCPPFAVAPPFGVTIMYWHKQLAVSPSIYGLLGVFNRTTVSGISPWAIQWAANGIGTSNSAVKFGDSDAIQTTAAFPTNTSAYSVTNLWKHVTHTIDFATKTTRTYVSGILSNQGDANHESDNSGLWLKQVFCGANGLDITFLKMLGGLSIAAGESSPSGIIDEIIIVGDVLPSSTIYQFYTQQSGYLTPPSPQESGIIGGFLNGIPIPTSSGYIGGYISGIPVYSSGYIGGYLFGVYNNSGLIGGYLNGITLETPYSGLIGGYLRGLTSGNDLIGGYIRGQLPNQQQSGIIGGYMAGVEDISLNATFYAFFNVIGRDKKEFDAAATIFKEAKAEFDARAIVYIDERYPTATIINPSIDQSGNSTPITYQFEATASGLDNKQIVFTQWFFSDIPITSGSIISSSGTYQTSHTFSKSGLFDVIFIAVDDKGLITSDRRKINTASGLALPTITLTATTQSGVAPLSVGFSGIINTAPASIKDKFIYFGDNTMSVSTDSIYKLYIVPGIYIPIFRVRDNRGVIVTDSLVIGVNN